MSTIYKNEMVLSKNVVGKKCDICGKESNDCYEHFSWFHGSHESHDWGNNSRDSIEYFDICSIDCFKNQLAKSIREMGKRKTGEIFGLPIKFVKELLERLV